jgi:hypothetical protein
VMWLSAARTGTLVVKSYVALVGPRVRFPADAPIVGVDLPQWIAKLPEFG